MSQDAAGFEKPTFELGPPGGHYGEDPGFQPPSAHDQPLRRMYLEHSPSPMERSPFTPTHGMPDPSRMLPSVPDLHGRPFFDRYNRAGGGGGPGETPSPGNFNWASLGDSLGQLTRGSAAQPGPGRPGPRGQSPTVSRTMMLRRTASPPQSQRCCIRCKLCQYTGLLVFVGVLAVIGYAIYNGGM